ncbi:MAG TPA: MFS transporter [Gemmatimonadaceae bacterium]|nr:MFS transporter [Gemmatimonadaceae bacterium]
MRARSDAPRWILAGSILGSGAVFLESTVATVALPAIGRALGLGVAGLQWVMNGYLLTLGALMLLGGALGDRFPRGRVLAVGLVAFAVASAACAAATGAVWLVACRVAQGAAGALVAPNSLAIVETTFAGEARGAAIGRWAAWTAVFTAIGPFLGGWLVDAASWRWVFATIPPFALAAAWIVARHARATDSSTDRGDGAARGPVDVAGALLATLGLAGIVGALTLAPDAGASSPLVTGGALGGVAALAAFVLVERRAAHPLLPLGVFRSRQFTGANATTLLVYAALGALMFLLMLELQDALGYDALAAGATLLPVNALMLLLSPRVGRLAQRIGARLPMALGAGIAAVGMLLFARVHPGGRFVDTVLPAVVVFGLGLSVLVAPLTAAVLGAVSDELAGVASGINNAVARLGGLLATAAIPLAAGLGGSRAPRGAALTVGFARAMWMCAALCAAGGLIAWLTVGRARPGPRQEGVQGAPAAGAAQRAEAPAPRATFSPRVGARRTPRP